MKFLAIFVLLAVSAQGKVVQLINSRSIPLTVTVGDRDLTVIGNGVGVATLENGWSGSISAVPEGAEVTDGPRTKAKLSIGEFDSYSISLVDGFNLGVKVIASGSSNCTAVVCAANILKVCPLANKIANSNGTVVACQNSAVIMTKLCPLAVVDDITTTTNVKTCSDATSYLVKFI